jgi:hypothetical protein
MTVCKKDLANISSRHVKKSCALTGCAGSAEAGTYAPIDTMKSDKGSCSET